MSSSISTSRARSLASHSRGWLYPAAFLAAAMLTWTIYALGSAMLLRDSVVLRSTKELIEFKLAPLRASGRPPYLIVISGSNALYSVDSPTLSRATGMPVVNAAMQWSYTYYVLEQVVRLARPGDVLLLPLEYEYFTEVEDQPKLEACYLIMQDRSGIRGAAEFLRLLSRCSPYLVLDALIADGLSRIGVAYPAQPVTSVLSAHGDILENTAGTNRWRQPTAATLKLATSFGRARLEALARLAVENGAKVLFSYPARPERNGDFPAVSAEWLDAYKEWAKSFGATVISEPERHMFPVSCFFDSPYHLHRGCTHLNSEAYAKAILNTLGGSGAPANTPNGGSSLRSR